MFHTDIVFDEKFFSNLLRSKKKEFNRCQICSSKNITENKFVVKVSKSMKIIQIGKHKNCKPAYGEVLCINKFSSNMFLKFLYFLKNYFKEKTNNITWEYPLSEFSKKKQFICFKKSKL